MGSVPQEPQQPVALRENQARSQPSQHQCRCHSHCHSYHRYYYQPRNAHIAERSLGNQPPKRPSSSLPRPAGGCTDPGARHSPVSSLPRVRHPHHPPALSGVCAPPFAPANPGPRRHETPLTQGAGGNRNETDPAALLSRQPQAAEKRNFPNQKENRIRLPPPGRSCSPREALRMRARHRGIRSPGSSGASQTLQRQRQDGSTQPST